jgi:hypothetical protein
LNVPETEIIVSVIDPIGIKLPYGEIAFCESGERTIVEDSFDTENTETGPVMRGFFINTVFDSTFVVLGIIIGSAFTRLRA